jgi:hypothetical protein
MSASPAGRSLAGLVAFTATSQGKIEVRHWERRTFFACTLTSLSRRGRSFVEKQAIGRVRSFLYTLAAKRRLPR